MPASSLIEGSQDVTNIKRLSALLGRSFSRCSGSKVTSGRITGIDLHNGARTAVLKHASGAFCTVGSSAEYCICADSVRISMGENDFLIVDNPNFSSL